MGKDDISVDLENARLEEQKEVMRRIVGAGECPFCPENLRKYHKLEVRAFRHWTVTENQWPYESTRVHLLFILNEHREDLKKMPRGAWGELFSLVKEEVRKRGIVGGALGLRFGATSLSGATVRHLHAQLIVPDSGDADYEPVKFYIGSPKK